MVSRFALVLAEGAHLVLVLSTPGSLEVCIGDWWWSKAHKFAQGLWEGPQPIFHTGQETVVAWRTWAGRVSREGGPAAELTHSCLDFRLYDYPQDPSLESYPTSLIKEDPRELKRAATKKRRCIIFSSPSLHTHLC
jgi:hypothetical protein